MFEVKETYTKSDIIFAAHINIQYKLQKLHLYKPLRVIYTVAGVMLMFFALTGTWGFVSTTVSALKQHVPLNPSGMFLALAELILAFCAGGLLLVNLRPVITLIACTAWKKFPHKDMLQFNFEDQRFTCIMPQTVTNSEYSMITDVCEDQTRFYLYGETIAHILRKDAFTQGSPQQFREFIAEKTGKPVELVE